MTSDLEAKIEDVRLRLIELSRESRPDWSEKQHQAYAARFIRNWLTGYLKAHGLPTGDEMRWKPDD